MVALLPGLKWQDGAWVINTDDRYNIRPSKLYKFLSIQGRQQLCTALGVSQVLWDASYLQTVVKDVDYIQ
jgi:hypothetical protein